ncbi:MAG: CaiB/BaiF CoA transferase family protein [Candidatus Dormibacteraceae bacterium]
MGGPLEGVRVVELGQLIAGPFVGRMLADFGAEVIKVEPPGSGDPLRLWGVHRYQDRGLWWPLMSRNKRLVSIDLRRPEGQEFCRRLTDTADVLVENFRPGTLERWGMAPDRLHETNPGLVVARVSGYGQTGPYARRAGFASASEAIGGLRYVNGYPGQVPPRPGVSLGDSLGGMFAIQGILLALYHRDAHHGSGQVVDVSITESCFAMLDSIVTEYGKLGIVREPAGSRIGSAVPSNVYRSRDGKSVVIAANADSLFVRLCAAMGRPELSQDERFDTFWARFEHVDDLDRIIGEWAAEHDAAEIDRVLNAAGVVCGPINSVADLFGDPQFEARDMLLPVEDQELGELILPGIVPKLSATPGEVRWPGSWQVGKDNDAVFGELLGTGARELARLREEQVV